MHISKLKVVLSLSLLFALAFFYLQQELITAQPSGKPDGKATAATNAEPLLQHTSAAPAEANTQSGNELSVEVPSQGVGNSTNANDGTISLDEILSRAAISTDNNVFPQQYRLDIATTALLTDAISRLDKDKLELHVFSAECYEALNECRVHYQASDSLVLHLMASFAGMSQIFDHATESGDTVLMIRYTPVGAANDSGTDN